MSSFVYYSIARIHEAKQTFGGLFIKNYEFKCKKFFVEENEKTLKPNLNCIMEKIFIGLINGL